MLKMAEVTTTRRSFWRRAFSARVLREAGRLAEFGARRPTRSTRAWSSCSMTHPAWRRRSGWGYPEQRGPSRAAREARRSSPSRRPRRVPRRCPREARRRVGAGARFASAFHDYAQVLKFENLDVFVWKVRADLASRAQYLPPTRTATRKLV